MPATLSSLTTQQRRTLIFLVGFVLALVLSGYLIYDLNGERATVARLKQEVERKEREAQAVQLPTLEEQNRWAEQEKQVNEILLPEQTVPLFFEEVTRVANENGLERLGINTEEIVLDPNKSTAADEATPVGIGVRRYLVVTLKFQGDYQNVARFLGGISKLPRPLEYRTVDIRRSPPKVEVMVVMNVYKREAA
jgi:Tfp pilus assembly protein PilO